ncbi:uncharacterized RING finger protein P8B7.15c-like [Solanum tuberosum]|uniref:Retinoblastoma-binding protein n=1 Tax=Solanum tuberosum TaxID=4113 RepID=M0ZMT3_SOLTU|nr:PREDICTED: uncharacterized RING finger protein P8B7.15c-like [Solanum tuberosum]
MAVYIKYKSCKDYDSIPILDHFISVGNLKSKIFESKRYGWGKDFDLLLTNAQTNEDYVDHATLIPRNTSVLIHRLPGLPCCPILIKEEPKQVLCKQEEVHSVKKESKYSQDDDFGDDVYAIPKVVVPSQLGNPVPTSTSSIIKNSIGNISLEYNNTRSPCFSVGQGGMERKNPPPGYVCHRCKVPGHFIQHCPTNGDPNYDIKKLSASVAVLMAAFTKEVEGLSCSSSSSKRSYRDIPAELHCPLCKGLMKDAVIASKCCFSSFCDRCIRNHIMSNSVCVCGARNILVDALLPNLTLRATVNRILQSNSTTSSESCRTRVEEFPPAVEEVNMKKPSDDVNMQWGVETRKLGFKRNKCEMSSEFSSVITY